MSPWRQLCSVLCVAVFSLTADAAFAQSGGNSKAPAKKTQVETAKEGQKKIDEIAEAAHVITGPAGSVAWARERHTRSPDATHDASSRREVLQPDIDGRGHPGQHVSVVEGSVDTGDFDRSIGHGVLPVAHHALRCNWGQWAAPCERNHSQPTTTR